MTEGVYKKSWFNIYLKLTVFTLLILNLVSVVKASDFIDSYDSRIKINKDGTTDINEIITYDFGSAQRHGITREIPITKTNEDGKKFKLEFYDFSVTDEVGNNINFTKTITGENLSLKIGDADKFVSGKKTYDIYYKVSGAVTNYTEYDELHWNITGNTTTVPIKNVISEIILPEELLSTGDIKADCFTGLEGSTQKNCVVNIEGDGVVTKVDGGLNPYEGLTVVVGLPKGIAQILESKGIWPSLLQKISTFLIPVAILFLLIFLVYLAYLIITKKSQLSKIYSTSKPTAPKGCLWGVHIIDIIARIISAAILVFMVPYIVLSLLGVIDPDSFSNVVNKIVPDSLSNAVNEIVPDVGNLVPDIIKKDVPDSQNNGTGKCPTTSCDWGSCCYENYEDATTYFQGHKITPQRGAFEIPGNCECPNDTTPEGEPRVKANGAYARWCKCR